MNRYTFKTNEPSVKLLYGVLENRQFLITQDYEISRLRKLASHYRGFDCFLIKEPRGLVLERLEY